MDRIIEQCPGCGGGLIVTQLCCTHCGTGLTGRFGTTVFDRLSSENLAFVEAFLRFRGNIKRMERESMIPYSKLRRRLADVIQELSMDGR